MLALERHGKLWCARGVWFGLEFLLFSFGLLAFSFPFLSPNWPVWAFFPCHPHRKVPASCPPATHIQGQSSGTCCLCVSSASGLWALGKGLLKNSNERGKKVKSYSVSTYSDLQRLQGFDDLDSLEMAPCQPCPRPSPSLLRAEALPAPRLPPPQGDLISEAQAHGCRNLRQPPSSSPSQGPELLCQREFLKLGLHN